MTSDTNSVENDTFPGRPLVQAPLPPENPAVDAVLDGATRGRPAPRRLRLGLVFSGRVRNLTQGEDMRHRSAAVFIFAATLVFSSPSLAQLAPAAAAAVLPNKPSVSISSVTLGPDESISIKVQVNKMDVTPAVMFGPVSAGTWTPMATTSSGKLTVTAPHDLGPGIDAAHVTASISAPGTANPAQVLIRVRTDGSKNDEREDFEATFYTGASIDSFAAQDLNNYLNPGDSSTKKLGYIAGIDFQYRLIGSPKGSQQLWVYGETIHGQRSADVDCTPKPDPKDSTKTVVPAQCGLLTGNTLTPNPGAFLGILREASSLEAYTGLRWEFLTLHGNGQNAAKLYAKSELGFFTIAGSGHGVFDSNQRIALGAVATNGNYNGSFLEAGWGKTDYFHVHPGRRFKVDGYLTWDLGGAAGRWMKVHGWRPFIEMTVDSDFGPGADSVRTYYGFNFDLRHLWNPAP